MTGSAPCAVNHRRAAGSIGRALSIDPDAGSARLRQLAQAVGQPVAQVHAGAGSLGSAQQGA